MISNEENQNQSANMSYSLNRLYSSNNANNNNSSSNNLNFSAKLLSNQHHHQQQQQTGILYNPMNGLFPFNNNNSPNNSNGNRFTDDNNSNLTINDFNNNTISRKEFTNPFQPSSQDTQPGNVRANNNNNTNNQNSSNYSLFGNANNTNNAFNTSSSTANYMDQSATSQSIQQQQNWPIIKNEIYSSSNGLLSQGESLTTNPFMNGYTNVFENPFIDHFNQPTRSANNNGPPQNSNNNPSNTSNNMLLQCQNNNNNSNNNNGSIISSDNEDIMSRSSQNSRIFVKTKSSTSVDRKQAPTIATGRRNLKNESVEPDEAERRMKRRERNRRSAQKCRERKVQRTQELQAQVEALKVEANNLLRELDSWRMQAKHCVQLLRQHCPHVTIPPMYFACLAEDERLSRASQVLCNTSANMNSNGHLNQNIPCEQTDRTTETLPSNGTFSSNSGILDEQIQLDYNVSEGISASTHSIHSCTPNSNGSVEHSSSMPENLNVIETTTITPMNHTSCGHLNATNDNSMIDINANCISGRTPTSVTTPSIYNPCQTTDIKPKESMMNRLKSPSPTPVCYTPSNNGHPSLMGGPRQLGRLPSGSNATNNNNVDLHSSSTCSSPLNFNDPFTTMPITTISTTPTTTSSSPIINNGPQLQMKLEPM